MIEVVDYIEPLAPRVDFIANCVVLAHSLAQGEDVDVLHFDHVLRSLLQALQLVLLHLRGLQQLLVGFLSWLGVLSIFR